MHDAVAVRAEHYQIGPWVDCRWPALFADGIEVVDFDESLADGAVFLFEVESAAPSREPMDVDRFGPKLRVALVDGCPTQGLPSL